jgi:hypothetical protein
LENTTIRWAIERNKITNYNTIDFCEVIWDCDIEPIINFCKTEEIPHITISSNFSSLITTLAGFEKQGCKIGGLTEVKSECKDWETGSLKRIVAIIVKM